MNCIFSANLFFLLFFNFIFSQNPIVINITGECSIISGNYVYDGILNGKYKYIKIFENNGQTAEFGVAFDGLKWVFYSYGNLSNHGFINVSESQSLNPPLNNWISTNCGEGTLTITNDLSYSSINETSDFLIYPNPTKNLLFFKNPHFLLKHYTFELNDLSGKSVKYGNINDNESISVYDLDNGFYFFSLFKEGRNVFTIKILKN